MKLAAIDATHAYLKIILEFALAKMNPVLETTIRRRRSSQGVVSPPKYGLDRIWMYR